MKSTAAKGKHRKATPVSVGSNNGVWLIAALLVGLLPFVVSPGGLDKFRLPKDVVFGVGTVAIAAVFFASNRVRPVWRWWSWETGLLASLVFLLLHSVLVGRVEITLPATLWVAAGCVLLFVLSRVASQSSQVTLWFCFAAASAINAILALLETEGKFPLLVRSTGETLAGRATPAGLVGDVNTGGFIFALCSLILLYPLVTTKKPGVRFGATLLIALNLTGLAVTRTLTAIVALSVVSILWFALYVWWTWRTRKDFRKSLVVASILLGIALGAVLIVFSYTGTTRRIIQTAVSVSRGRISVVTAGRYPVYVITVDMIKQRPLAGRGLATFGTDFFEYRAGNAEMAKLRMVDQPGAFREVHNEYLQVCEELGVPGLIVFVALLFVPVVAGFRTARRAADPKVLYWWGHLALGVLFTAVASLGFFPFHVSLSALAIILVLAGLRQIVVAGEYLPAGESTRIRPLPAWRLVVAGAAGVVLLYPLVQLWRANGELGVAEAVLNRAAGSSLSQWQKAVFADTALTRLRNAERMAPLLYEGHNLQGSANMMLGNYEEAVRQYRKAARYIPSPELLTNLAVALMASKRNAEAQQMLETALRYNPQYLNANRALRYLRRTRR